MPVDAPSTTSRIREWAPIFITILLTAATAYGSMSRALDRIAALESFVAKHDQAHDRAVEHWESEFHALDARVRELQERCATISASCQTRADALTERMRSLESRIGRK